jgi:hypothetical protein
MSYSHGHGARAAEQFDVFGELEPTALVTISTQQEQCRGVARPKAGDGESARQCHGQSLSKIDAEAAISIYVAKAGRTQRDE